MENTSFIHEKNQGMLRNKIQTSQVHISLENESVDVTET